MDYLDQVTIVRHASFAVFEEWRRQAGLRLLLLSTRAARDYRDVGYKPR